MSGVAGMPLPDWDLEPCGTLAAYRRHLRRGDPVDETCRQAVARSWHDRVAAGYQRPSRAGRHRWHLPGTGGKALCGGQPRLVTDLVHEATCQRCLAVLARHEAKVPEGRFGVVLARQAAAAAVRDRAWAERAA